MLYKSIALPIELRRPVTCGDQRLPIAPVIVALCAQFAERASLLPSTWHRSTSIAESPGPSTRAQRSNTFLICLLASASHAHAPGACPDLRLPVRLLA